MGTKTKKPSSIAYFRNKYPRLSETPISEGEMLYGLFDNCLFCIDIKPGQNFWDNPNATFYAAYVVVSKNSIQTFSHP